jgi:hypothetical protein
MSYPDGAARCPLDPPGRSRDGIVGPASGRDQIAARQCDLRPSPDTHLRHLELKTDVLPGCLVRFVRGCNIAGGQGRDTQREVAKALLGPAKLCGLDGRVRCPCLVRKEMSVSAHYELGHSRGSTGSDSSASTANTHSWIRHSGSPSASRSSASSPSAYSRSARERLWRSDRLRSCSRCRTSV